MAKMSYAELRDYVSQVVTLAKLSNGSFVETRDNTVGLLDKIGKIVTLDTNFVIDKLNAFDGEYLSDAKSIEEYQQDLIMIEDFNASGSGAMSPHRPTYRPVFYSYTLGKKYIPTTIDYNDIERAVHFVAQMVEIVSMKYKRLEDSMASYRYEVKRQIVGRLCQLCCEEMDASGATTFVYSTSYSTINTILEDGNGVVGILVKAYTANDATDWDDAVEQGFIIPLDLISVLAHPTTTATGEAFIEQLKKDVEVASDLSEGHSLNGNSLGATEGLILIVKQGIMPDLEVKTWAGAFNENRVAIPTEVIVLKDFGDDEYTNADADTLYKPYAVLLDRRGFRLHNTFNATYENLNGEGAFLNIFKHTEDTAFISKNTYVKVYCETEALS